MSPCVPLHGLLTSEHNLYWTSFVFLDIASKDMYIKSLVDSQISNYLDSFDTILLVVDVLLQRFAEDHQCDTQEITSNE